MTRFLDILRQHVGAHFFWRWFLRLLGSGFVAAAAADEGKGVNGGQLIETGSVHVEFIGGAGYELLMFAVSDSKNRPVTMTGSSAFVLIELNGKRYRIPLRSDGDNLLSARASSPLKPNASVVFVAEFPNGARLKASFSSR